MSKHLTALEKAIKAAGGPTKLGRLLGVQPQAVSGWKNNGLPPSRVLDVERASGVTRYELRPDIYPPEPASRAGGHEPQARPRPLEKGGGTRGPGHFSRFKHLRRNHFASAQEVNEHIAALREEWDRR